MREDLLRKRIAQSLRGRPDAGKDPEGLIHHPSQFEGLRASTEILAKDVADKLVKLYPGWMWAVQPDQRGGIINIFCWDCHDEWGYTIRSVDIQHDPKRTEAMRAGGEVLARFGLRPGSKRSNAAALAEMRRDSRGRLYPVHLDEKVATRQQLKNWEIDKALREGKADVHVAGGQVYMAVKQ